MTSIPPYKIVSGLNRRENWAIELILKSNQDLVNKLISQFFGQTAFSKDLASDAWAALLDRKKPFESLNDITRFLNSTTINICKSARRKDVTREDHQERLIYHLRSMEEDDIEIAEANAYKDMLIRRKIARIPGKTAQVFHMLFIEKRSEQEIASQLNISEKTVMNHLSAGYRFLKMDRENARRSFTYTTIILLLIYIYETL